MIHCDNCDREINMTMVELREKGGYMSSDLSISGIPNTLYCPKCAEIMGLNKLKVEE